ncbi:F-box/LRR-repeat protein 25-like protein [Tanacetum coccineum]
MEEEDRLSLLPDWLIIVEILSRLESTKEAIRTGILSKRWLRLWTLVPNLVFNIQIYYEGIGVNEVFPPIDGYYSIVDQTINQCPLNINKLYISTRYHFQFDANITNWIRYAINRNVHEFHLIIPRLCAHLSRFVLPQLFFSSSSFTLLELDGCIFNPTGSIAWKNLKSLSVSRAKLDNDLIQNILSGSPLLETFKLEICYGFTRLDIPLKSFKNLVFSGFFDRDDRTRRVPHEKYIEINAPYALSLTINDTLALTKLSLLNVSSLIRAELDYQYGRSKSETDEMLKGLIQSLRHVKELTIGKNCSWTLDRLKAKGFTFPPNMNKSVESIENEDA